MDWDWESDDEEFNTAYHEAGHAIVGCALGAQIDSVSLSQASMFDDTDDAFPRRFGDCIVNWGRVDSDHRWQQQRELLTILAGPVAEWIYRGEDADESIAATWTSDWEHSLACVQRLVAGHEQQMRLLRSTVSRLQRLVAAEPVWPAVAALADELMIGDPVEADRVAELVRFWWQA